MGFGHIPELIIVMLLALLIFGPKKLPEMGSAVGKTIKEFRKTMSEVTEPDRPASERQISSTSTPSKVTVDSGEPTN